MILFGLVKFMEIKCFLYEFKAQCKNNYFFKVFGNAFFLFNNL